MSEKIKCCPFCGSDQVEIARANEKACWVECFLCSARSKSAASREKAIANWNRRKKPRDKFASISYDMDLEFQQRGE